jgi:hypothetical protein
MTVNLTRQDPGQTEARTANSTCNKSAVQWLHEALCCFGNPIRIKISAGRQFYAAKLTTSYSYKNVGLNEKYL